MLILFFGFAFYVVKKIFKCRDEIDFGVHNRFIGTIWLKKMPKEENDNTSY
ncbi:hypothetical protein CHRY9390_02957 [Chryseobacterium aquaeductus]|uniref:Uncharacterized protein n=1 Tax=Chryseobacterium aquaeductus TaxID=2675056 RepID=A0A9N8MIX9_9FLAO|nr:hypothetical protein CHRY9390_02957 [Chryseobacterium potabilaquae]CAD7815343.1 hypothetical protein CHRY9390_02957 [Chryseobacterium aquaeductus]